MTKTDAPKTKVGVIDNNRERRNAMASAFTSAGCEVVQFYESHDRYGNATLKSDPASEPSASFQLVLCHTTDRELATDTRLGVPGGVTCTSIIYYGGSGGNDSNIPNGALRIWRQILGGTECLNETEAQEIVSFINSNMSEEMPVCLQPPKNMELLPALSILCQGYLGVHAAPGSLDVDVEVKWREKHTMELVKEALRTMKWNEVKKEMVAEIMRSPEGRARLRDGDPDARIVGVTSPAWWLDVFRGRKNLVDDVRGEWGSSPNFDESVKPLLEAILGKEKIEPGCVVEAFNAIYHRLKSER